MNQVPVAPTEVLLIGFDLSHGEDKQVCIVGRKDNNGKTITIVNAFGGQKARDIFNLLTTVVKKDG